MSALAASNAVNPNSHNLAQAEADLRTEATAIEKLRKQISEAGSGATKEMMASFAKRQKAYLDRKIDLEKQKRGLGEAPKTAATAVAPASAPVVEKKPEPAKPVEVAKPARPSEKKAAEEPAKPAKPSTKEAPAAKTPETKVPETKKVDAPEIPLKPAAKKAATEEKKVAEKSDKAPGKSEKKAERKEAEKSTESPKERKTESSPEKKGGGISPIIWLLAVASIAVVIWHFASR